MKCLYESISNSFYILPPVAKNRKGEKTLSNSNDILLTIYPRSPSFTCPLGIFLLAPHASHHALGLTLPRSLDLAPRVLLRRASRVGASPPSARPPCRHFLPPPTPPPPWPHAIGDRRVGGQRKAARGGERRLRRARWRLA